MEEFETANFMQGFYIYQEIRSSFLGEVLACRKEENPRDRYAVTVCMMGETVGHVPKNISTVCSKFITHGRQNILQSYGWTTIFEGSSTRRNGIPCMLRFTGNAIELNNSFHLFLASLLAFHQHLQWQACLQQWAVLLLQWQAHLQKWAVILQQ